MLRLRRISQFLNFSISKRLLQRIEVWLLLEVVGVDVLDLLPQLTGALLVAVQQVAVAAAVQQHGLVLRRHGGGYQRQGIEIEQRALRTHDVVAQEVQHEIVVVQQVRVSSHGAVAAERLVALNLSVDYRLPLLQHLLALLLVATAIGGDGLVQFLVFLFSVSADESF